MICEICNKEFIKSHHSQKYCSKKCSKANKKRATKKYRQSDKGKETIKKLNQTAKAKETVKKYRQTPKRQEYRKKFQQSDENKESHKKYAQSDKGKKNVKRYQQSYKGRETLKKYRELDITKISIRKAKKKYRQSDKGKEFYSEYVKERRKTDPIFKLSLEVRNRLRAFLKVRNIRKTNRTFKMVGCTPEFLKEYLEKKFKPGMSWKNHSMRGWHIDHRIPLDSAKTYEDIERLIHYTNLQPMWAIENLKKSNKILPD